MKIAEIVRQLAETLPLISDRYSDNLEIVSISGDGVEATIQTSQPHGFSTGSPVFITNALIENVITTVTLVGNKAIIETAANHDLTKGFPPHEFVNLSGFTDNDWNDDFKLLEVKNRRQFTIDVEGIAAPVLTGSEVLNELIFGGFNGVNKVDSIINTTTFTVLTSFSTPSKDGNVVTNIRIAGTATEGRAAEEYTNQPEDKLWLFVTQKGDVSLSKDRKSSGDSLADTGVNTSFQLDIIDGFTVLCFVPSKNQKTGLPASDLARHDVLGELLLSIQRFTPESGLANETDNRVLFAGHSTMAYTGSVYAHRFDFEILFRMTSQDTHDKLQERKTVAFRNIDLQITNEEKKVLLTALINLDEEPIE